MSMCLIIELQNIWCKYLEPKVELDKYITVLDLNTTFSVIAQAKISKQKLWMILSTT